MERGSITYTYSRSPSVSPPRPILRVRSRARRAHTRGRRRGSIQMARPHEARRWAPSLPSKSRFPSALMRSIDIRCTSPTQQIATRLEISASQRIAARPRRNYAHLSSRSGAIMRISSVASAHHWMVVRENSDRLGLPRTARMLEFENWFYEHVVGV